MGAGLVTAAYDVAARIGLDHAPTRAYVYMANVALDADHHPTYWKGRENVAHALGRTDANGHRAATRAIDALVTAGAIARVSRSAPGGRNARYALLDGTGAPLRAIHNAGRSASPVVPGTRDAQPPTNVGRSAPNAGRSAVGTRDGQRPVEEEEEKKEERRAGAPAPTCLRHLHWDHDERCRACAADRRAAEAFTSSARPSTMSPRVVDCGPGNHTRLQDGTCTRCENRDLQRGAA